MPKITNKKEIISFQGLTISDFLNEDFLDKIKKIGKEVEAINLIFMVKEENGKKKKINPLVLGHHDNEEVSKKIINIDAPPEICEKVVKIFEEME